MLFLTFYSKNRILIKLFQVFKFFCVLLSQFNINLVRQTA
jgi:hypothetical protein